VASLQLPTPLFVSLCAATPARRVRATLRTPFALRTRPPLAHAHAGLAHLLHSSLVSLLKTLEAAVAPLRQVLMLQLLRYLDAVYAVNIEAYDALFPRRDAPAAWADPAGDPTWGAQAAVDVRDENAPCAMNCYFS